MLLKLNFRLLLLLSASLMISSINAEFYSSIQETMKLYMHEHKLLLSMQKFISDNESKLDYLKARLSEFEQQQAEAEEQGVAYFDSPVNKFMLTKRLTLDWQRIENLMLAPTGEKPLQILQKLQDAMNVSAASELEGAIDGILRLQHVYRLRTEDMASGNLDGVNYGIQLSAIHCLDIARQALQNQQVRLAHAWLLAASSRLTVAERDELQLLALLLQVKLELGDFQGVDATYNELIQLQPGNRQLVSQHEAFRQVYPHMLNVSLDLSEEHEPIPANLETLDEFDAYRYTCNGHIRPTATEQRHLRCAYLTETHPFLLLAPIKVEELHLYPLLVVYHDVIYQSEINIIMRLLRNNISRAHVMGQNHSIISNVRTSQFVFLPKTRHKVLQTIDQRVSDMTNMNMNYAEEHQFSNYGIGGHYAQHMDWFVQSGFDTNQVQYPEMGNRIATVLFYLTDVAQGGGTAFPRLKQLLMPKKGAAAFWYNLHSTGVGDTRTLHGACPTIVGSKWVQNRWIREIDQSDRRPCEMWDDSKMSLSELTKLFDEYIKGTST